MKKIIFFSLWIFFIPASFAQQKTFYYYGDKKIELDLDTNTVVFKSAAAHFAEREIPAEDLEIVKDDKNKTVKLKPGKEYKYSKTELIEKLRSLNAHAWYQLKLKGEIVIPTGEVIFKPKKGVSYEAVFALVKKNVDIPVKLISVSEYGYVLMFVEEIGEVLHIANIIYETGLVEWSNPNLWAAVQFCSSDPLFEQQYYLKNTGQNGGLSGIDIYVEPAWCISKGANIKVAVIDDGVEAHEELTGRLLSGFTPRDPNGFGAPTPIHKHGQACAGIIGASQNNNKGISGVAPECKIIPVNIMHDSQETAEDLANAINWAWNYGQADVLSNSWKVGLTPYSNVIIDAINNARTLGRGGKGCAVVFAAGNDNSSVSFPGSVNNVITVGAITKNGHLWDYSNEGPSMDVVAPSGNVNNTGDLVTLDRMGIAGYNSSNYTSTFGGTSGACPQVAGIAALVLGANPNLTESQVRTAIQQTAVDMGSPGYDHSFGFGRVNAFQAVKKNLLSVSGPSALCSMNGVGTYILSGAPAGAIISWSMQPAANLATMLEHGNACQVARIANTNGLLILTATVSICGQSFSISKYINIGKPYGEWSAGNCIYPFAALETGLEEGPCNTQCYSASISKWWCAQPVFNATNVTWQKVASVPSNYNFWNASWSGNNNHVNVLFKGANQYVELKATLSNACGNVEQYYCFTSTAQQCQSSLMPAGCKSFEVGVIASTKTISIQRNANDCNGTGASLDMIRVFDKLGSLVKEIPCGVQTGYITLNFSDLKNDFYVIAIFVNGAIESYPVVMFN